MNLFMLKMMKLLMAIITSGSKFIPKLILSRCFCILSSFLVKYFQGFSTSLGDNYSFVILHSQERDTAVYDIMQCIYLDNY